MGYLILVSQQSYKAMLHILNDILGMPKSEWPEKYISFEKVVNGFMSQADETKPQVGHIVQNNLIKDFLDTIGGYKSATIESLNMAENDKLQKHLSFSVKVLAQLTKELNNELAEQKFSVNKC